MQKFNLNEKTLLSHNIVKACPNKEEWKIQHLEEFSIETAETINAAIESTLSSTIETYK